MPKFILGFRGPGAPQGRTAEIEAESLDQAQAQLRQEGFEPLMVFDPNDTIIPKAGSTEGLSPVVQAPFPPQTLGQVAEPRLPGLGTPADVAQLAGGALPVLAALALRRPELIRLAGRVSPVTALGARVGVGELLRHPGEGRVERGATELMRGAPGELLSVPGFRAGARLGRTLVGETSRFLPALRRLAPSLGAREAERMLTPEAESAVGRVTTTASQTIRKLFGPIIKKELGGVEGSRKAARTLVRSVAAGPDREAALLAAYSASKKVRFDRLTTGDLQTLIKTRPTDLLRGVQEFVKKGGDAKAADRVRRLVVQTRMSDLFRRSLVSPPRTPYPGAFEGRIIDPNTLATGIGALRKQLGPEGERLAFGRGLAELNHLSQTLGHEQLAREVALGPGRKVARQTTAEFLRLRPFGRALALGIGRATGLGGPGELAAVFAEESIAEMLGHFAGTEAGLRWIAAGLDAQRGGLPDQILIPLLARMLPNALASLDIGPSRETVSAAVGVAGFEGLSRLRPEPATPLGSP